MPSSWTRLPDGIYGLKIKVMQVTPMAQGSQLFAIGLSAEVLQPMEFATKRIFFTVGYGPFDQQALRDIFEACNCHEVEEPTPKNAWQLSGSGMVAEVTYNVLPFAGTQIEIPTVKPLLRGPDQVYKDPRIARLEWAKTVKDAVVEEERPEAEERIVALELEAGLFCSCEEPAIERRVFDSFAYDWCGLCKKEVKQ